jgi:hypothetical protein
MNSKHFLTQLREKYDSKISRYADRYINIATKIAKHELDIAFITKCLNNEVLPNFSQLRLATNNNKTFINSIRSQITQQEATNKRSNKKKLESTLQQLLNELFDLTPSEFETLFALTNKAIVKVTNRTTRKHRKKLQDLGIEENIVVNSRFINKNRNNIEQIEEIADREVIYNYSSRTLNEIENSVLKKGLKYGIRSKKTDEYEILARFEQLAQYFNDMKAEGEKDNRKTQLDPKNTFLQQLQSMAFEFIELSKNATDSLTDTEHKALEELAKDKSIVITKADKGNAVVIQDLTDYLAKVDAILGKGDKFKQLTEDETRKRETRLQGYLRKLLKDKLLTKGVFNKISPCGSRSGIMYGLPKIHKEGAPIRPIISSIGTYNYRLAKYLDEILKPLTTKNNFIIKDTFDFVNKVSKLETTDEQHVVSFDVESLFYQHTNG